MVDSNDGRSNDLDSRKKKGIRKKSVGQERGGVYNETLHLIQKKCRKWGVSTRKLILFIPIYKQVDLFL